MSYIPPGQGMGRMFGESGPRVTDEELEQDAHAHERVEEASAHRREVFEQVDSKHHRDPRFFSKLFRRSGRSEG